MKLLIGTKYYQKYLKLQNLYDSAIDGIIGPKTRAGTRGLLEKHEVPVSHSWSWDRAYIAAVQIIFQELGFYNGAIDGLDGPNTQYAVELWQNAMRGVDDEVDDASPTANQWPTYDQMRSFYGQPGTNLGMFDLPYPMRLAWDKETVVNRVQLHNRCGPSAIRVLENVLQEYGLAKIQELRLDLFGGAYNDRPMRGGSRLSTHAWAAAIDFDPTHNQFRWNSRRASLDDNEYDAFWKFWEDEGWVSLGRERNFDWMHVQACRL